MDPKLPLQQLALGETAPASSFGDDSLELDAFDDRYETLALLGRGGMGEVHRCFDKLVGREIAMKTILPQARAAGLARFVREAKVQARLEHPSVVPVYDIGTRADGSVWFTMRRVNGRSLEDVLDALAASDPSARAEFTRRKLLTAFVAVCYAIAFAHERGVIHRDLKPANIMLGAFGEISVLDWGIAKIAGVPDDDGAATPLADLASGARPTEQGLVVGTPGYMSPEQARAAGAEVGPASDVYALGAILFELLAERPLHLGATSAAVIASTLMGVDARPSARGADVVPELDALCVAATATDASARTVTARDLARAVERYLDGDRDLARRRELAGDHADAARRELGDGAVDRPTSRARAAALLELGRALALDPSNADARDLMARLMMTTPDDVPPEARAELERERVAGRRRAAHAAAVRYGIWCPFALFVFWMGVRDAQAVAFGLAFIAATSGVAFWMSRRANAGPNAMLALLATSSIAVAATSVVFGPFLIVPSIAATNAMYFAMVMGRRHRRWAMLASAAAIAVPFVSEALGLLPPAYDIGKSPESFHVLAWSAYFPRVPTEATLLFTAIATAVVSVTMIGRMRDALTRAEERLFLQAWQLRATLPADLTRNTTHAVAR